MSYLAQANAGLAAAEAKKWDEAVNKLSIALKESQNPAWLVVRSKALINLGRFQEALDDANLGWHKAYDRNKRNLLVEAHYRRAVAYFRLGEYANADACCVYAMNLVKGSRAVEKEDPAKKRTDENGFYLVTLEEAKEESKNDELNKQTKGDISAAMSKGPAQLKEWRAAGALRIQILYKLEKLPADDPARKLTIGIKPEQKELVDHAKQPEATPQAAAPKPVVPSDTPLRLQDFQTNTNMSVSIFSKGVNKEKLQVQYLPNAVILDSVIYPSGDEKPFRLDLWGEIDTEASKHTVTPNKVELNLKKKTPGKWAALKAESKEEETVDAAAAREEAELKFLKDAKQKAMQASDDAAKSTPTEAKEKPTEPAKPAGPSYPSSSKSGPKNWDQIGADEDEDDGSDVNGFFKKLFKGANPEQQRAMMKSFTESNGTSLSTDWNDVKDRKVETIPPDGVEAKKWDK